ncbi:hypothetical protein [Paludibacter sp.]|uniref:hypothetical protein n=1 Tax=Paludibacter sp. TaxID=1898105 RepID=UPI0013537291|nr:hypothetical protein [Paludibacter sp.]MTK53297.1 hypothetical protein [Paludibacter sp.]
MQGILLTDTNDLQLSVVKDSTGLITSGMVVGNSDYQRARLITMFRKGEVKEYPTLGFGIEQYNKAVVNTQKFASELETELNADGFKNPRVTVTENLETFEIEL